MLVERPVQALPPSPPAEPARHAELLRSSPLLRAARLAGEITVSAADAVMPVAVREEEAAWVERAKRETVRALDRSVEARLAGGTPDESASPAVGDGDRWYRLVVSLDREKAEVVDGVLAVAGVVVGLTSSRGDRLEAMAMEFDAEYPLDNAPSETWCGGAAARKDVPRDGAVGVGGCASDAPGRRSGETAPASAWAVGPQLAVSQPMRSSQGSGPAFGALPGPHLGDQLAPSVDLARGARAADGDAGTTSSARSPSRRPRPGSRPPSTPTTTGSSTSFSHSPASGHTPARSSATWVSSPSPPACGGPPASSPSTTTPRSAWAWPQAR